MSQSALAGLLGVSPEAVSEWEREKYAPSPEKLEKLREELGLDRLGEDGSERNLRLFHEAHMSAWLKGRLDKERFPEASGALVYAKEKHAGQFRKPEEAKIPYIIHPLTMTCHALAMGLEDDALLAALLLHDVSEDCGVKPEDLPVCPEAQEIVRLVTKPQDRSAFSEEAYYGAIAGNPKACMVKCIDRCNNLSSMAAAFSPEKMKEYIDETETWYPRLLEIIKGVPSFNNAAWLLNYQIKSVIRTVQRFV